MSNKDIDRAIDILARNNPVTTAGLGASVEASDWRREAALVMSSSRLGEESDSRRRAVVPRRLVPAAIGGIALVIAVISVVATITSTRKSPAHAATPPMLAFYTKPDVSAGQLLNGLAAKAERQARAAVAGPYAYVQMQVWNLNSAVTSDGVTSAVAPERAERWACLDGTGRMRTIRGQVQVVRVGSRSTLEALTFQGGGPVNDVVLDPRSGSRADLYDVGSLSSDPSILVNQLLTNSGGLTKDPDTANDPVELQRVRNILTLFRQQPLTPELHAALLRVLARTPGFQVDGEVTDRLGRAGIAVSLDVTWGRPYRFVLIFDPATGALLGDEQIATTKYGNGEADKYLNVEIPAVVSYFAYIDAAWVANTTTRFKP